LAAVKQYEQVAERLRTRVVDGALRPGARLPNEAVLARDFGVSRATVREALRVLAAQNLIRTAKGAGGGSYVTVPSVSGVSDFLHSSITVLADAEDVTLEDLLEARELLEVPAARLSAKRRSETDLERLRAAVPDHPLALGALEQFAYNRDFHAVVIEGCGNALLLMAAQPVFDVLQRNLARSRLGRTFHRAINEHHRAIAAAIEAGDANAAADEMHSHLEYLRPFYERAWQRAGRARSRP
jgi:GntR family transcriptional regulator, transcriptional repressor for pyruvate dehydrogenase complex